MIYPGFTLSESTELVKLLLDNFSCIMAGLLVPEIETPIQKLKRIFDRTLQGSWPRETGLKYKIVFNSKSVNYYHS